MTDIVLDEDAHLYSNCGMHVPGVSEILRPLLGKWHVSSAQLKFLSDRGRAVHRAVELHYSPGGLDRATLDDEVRPRFDSYMKFVDESKFMPMLSEYIVYHTDYDYAGKLDLYGSFPDGTTAIIDIKCGNIEPQAGYQTAAYQAALACEFPSAVAALRYALWLGVDAYKLEPFTSATDWATFQNELVAWKASRMRVAVADASDAVDL